MNFFSISDGRHHFTVNEIPVDSRKRVKRLFAVKSVIMLISIENV